MAAQILAADELPPPPLARWLAVPAGAAPEERLRIHVEGYPARLHDALADEFPAVAHLVGASRFAALVRRYLNAAALRSYNLNHAGAELPAFLVGDPLGAEWPFLPDLATLEGALARAFHAFDVTPLTVADLRALDAETIVAGRVRFQPSVTVCASPWPIHTLWQSRSTPHELLDVDLTVGESVVVWRAAGVDCAPLDGPRATALRALLDGASLGDVAAAQADPAAAIAWLGDWIAAGMVAECGV